MAAIDVAQVHLKFRFSGNLRSIRRWHVVSGLRHNFDDTSQARPCQHWPLVVCIKALVNQTTTINCGLFSVLAASKSPPEPPLERP